MGDGQTPPQVEVEHFHGVSLARVSGTIDERLTKDAFAVLKGRGSPVVVDLDGVDGVTSLGVRAWLAILHELPTERYYFVKCRAPVFRQFSLVADFGGRGHVLSFYCHYRCPSCGCELDALVDLRRERAQVLAKKAPAVRCPRCGQPAALASDEASYFERAATWNVPRLAHEVESVLDGRVPTAALRIDKTVRGTLTVVWLSGTLDKAARLRGLFDGLEGPALLILGGLSVASPESLDLLASLLEASGAEIYLARVPLPIFLSFAATPSVRRNGSIVSVVAELRCTACGASVEQDLLLWRDGEPADAGICPHCHGAGVPPPSVEVREALAAVATARPPAAASAFLGSDTPPPYPVAGAVPLGSDSIPR